MNRIIALTFSLLLLFSVAAFADDTVPSATIDGDTTANPFDGIDIPPSMQVNPPTGRFQLKVFEYNWMNNAGLTKTHRRVFLLDTSTGDVWLLQADSASFILLPRY